MTHPSGLMEGPSILRPALRGLGRQAETELPRRSVVNFTQGGVFNKTNIASCWNHLLFLCVSPPASHSAVLCCLCLTNGAGRMLSCYPISFYDADISWPLAVGRTPTRSQRPILPSHPPGNLENLL